MQKFQFYKETKFKDTEIGRIPEDWDTDILENIISPNDGIKRGPWGSMLRKEFFVSSGYKVYEQKNVILNRFDIGEYYITEEKFKELKDYEVKPGDILITSAGSIGEIAIVPESIEPGIFNQALIRIRLNENKIDKLFFVNLWRSSIINKQLQTLSWGATQKNLGSVKFIKNLKLPLPPLEEQKAIAEVLSTIDKEIENIKKAIENTEKLKKTLMNLLLTGKIRIKNENGKFVFYKETKFKNTEIGRIPEDWDIKKLEDIVEIYDSKRIPLNEIERLNRKGPYPYCGANGIIDYIDNYIFDGEFVLLAEDGGYYGPFENSAYLMSGKFWANNHVHVLKAKEEISNNRFLVYMLNFLDLRPYLVGSTRPKLNQEAMRKIKIPLPPLEEQKAIAEVLSTIDKKKELLQKKKELMEKIKKWFMQKLLTGEIRIKIV